MTTQPKQPSWRTDKRSSTERGYGSAWRKVRNAYLYEHPLCVMCLAMTPSRVVPANVVDHIVPHKGDQVLMWDVTNFQSLCAPHHNSDKQMLERSGRTRTTFDADGRVVW